MYSEDDLIQLSALQHILFCERQCALIHIEQLWSENLYTAQGRIMHERVDRSGHESREDLRVVSGLAIRSLALGLSGKTDMVEFHRRADGVWQPFPVEYKRGRPKKDDSDRVQLCAQALCLEEMTGVSVPEGALFYGKNRRRQQVALDERLRLTTIGTAGRLHVLLSGGVTPPAVYGKKCESCSLLTVCLPRVTGGNRSVARYLRAARQL